MFTCICVYLYHFISALFTRQSADTSKGICYLEQYNERGLFFFFFYIYFIPS